MASITGSQRQEGLFASAEPSSKRPSAKKEEGELANVTVAAVQAAREVIEAGVAKVLLRAPAAGTIAILVSEIGETCMADEPLLTFAPGNGIWFRFNARRDNLADWR